jgi:hypothetical protein
MNQEYFSHTFGPNQVVHYRRLPSGTCLNADTPDAVADILESYRMNQRRIRLFYGNLETGQSWHEENDVVGRIGRSTGPIKVPLLLEPGECGGPALLDQCIIRIDTPKKVLYQHDNFQTGEFSLIGSNSKRLPWEVWINQSCHARFKDKTQARQYMEFLQGKRFEFKH